MKVIVFLWLALFCSTVIGSQQHQKQQQQHQPNAVRYNILAFLPTEVKSHFMGFKPLLRALVAKGHNLTLVSPYSIGETELPHNFIKVEPRPPFDFNMLEVAKSRVPDFLGVWGFGLFNTDSTLDKPAVQNFLRNDRSAFDVVLFENFVHECFVALGHKYGAPVVQILPASTSVRVSQWHGQPYDPSYVPEFTMGFTDRMTFVQRVRNTVSALCNTWLARAFYLPRQQALADKHFVYPGYESRPPLTDMLRNVSLTLVNSHPAAVGYPAPTVPGFVNVAGMHCVPSGQLPEDLKVVMETAPHGVVYFSLGSNVKSSQMPEETVSMLLAVFATIKETVLWKWESDKLPNLPKNVIVRKWFPQNDILGHPKCKLFITHGGIHSLIETTYHGLPMLGISVFGDQMMNVLLAEQRGYAIHVPYFEMTQEKFHSALHRLIDDPSYAANAKRVSTIFNDNPQRPLDKAVYWIEYVTRHGGASHLRTAAMDLYWFQYYLLDVGAVLSAVLFAVSYVIFKLFACCLCRGKSKKPKVKKN